MSRTSAAHAGIALRRAARLLDPHAMTVVLVALVVEVGLRLVALPRLTRLLGIRLIQDGESAHEGNPTLSPGLLAWIRRRQSVVNRVLRHSPFEDTCLRRALILGQRIHRLDPMLAIGVRHDDLGALSAHAWLVVAGVALDPLAARYETLHHPGRE